LLFLRAKPANPARPVQNNNRVAGSGTGATVPSEFNDEVVNSVIGE
jgi:hypothetical protein